ncbi:MAG: OmpH/Skp family outer membrane protein [Planctomycetota bacterium]|jgi:Skp family chaperone for outer membrane proteins
MKHTAFAISALLIAVALAASVRAQDAQPEPGAFPILICDFAKVIESCEEAKDIEEAFKKERDAAEKDLKTRAEKLQATIQDIQKKTKLSERDENTYAALKKAIEDKGKLDAELAFRNVRDQDYLQRRMQELLRGAKSYAKDTMIARKAHMVLATKVGQIQLDDQKQTQDELLRRRVVAHVKGVNITESVMKKMNDEYAKRKAAKKG